jgi:hypothetical protein
MQELRLVAVSEDGSYAVLVVPGRSGRFALPIDERLRTVARGQFSRLAQYEIEVESPLRPKEIQDRIRAGETAEEIADVAGLPVDRIRRFEGPVLAEREFRATEAQRATVRGPGEAGYGQRLGEIVTQRLSDLGVSEEEQDWDSRKRQDGNWQVQLAYTIAGRMHMAEWVYDPKGRHATPDDDEAARLCLDEAFWPQPRQSAPAVVTATVTPIGSRTAGAASHPADHRGEPDRPTAGRAMLHPSRTASAPVSAAAAGATAPGPGSTGPASTGPASTGPASTASRQPAAHVQAHADQAPAEIRATGPVSGPGDQASQSGEHRRAEARPGRERGVAPESESTAPAASESLAQEPDPEAAPPVRQGRRASGGRSRRSSVPSWDEIMFGNSRQPE